MHRTSDSLADRLRQAVIQSPISAAELASRMGISRAYVSHWVVGRRVPSAEQLDRIAVILKVDSGWLRGDAQRASRPREGRRTMAAQASTATEEQPSLLNEVDSEWWWRHEPEDGGRDYGNPNVFATPPDLPTLGRETGQNSVDYLARPGAPVHMRYTVIELTEGSEEYRRFMEVVRFDDLKDHIDAAAATPSKLGSRLRSGLERLREERRLVLLRIDDFGTTGLFGDERPHDQEDKNPFAALCRNNLDSAKLTTTAGGSFGLGKAVLWRCSDLSTVLFASDVAQDRRQPGHVGTRVIGKSELTWHEAGGGAFAGPGWLAQRGTDANSMWVSDPQLLRDLQLDRSRLPDGVDPRRASGTSILIVGFRDPQGQDRLDPAKVAADLATAMAANFWPLMIQGRLSVTVERWTNGELKEELTVDPHDYVDEMCDVLERHYDNEVVEELCEPGDVARFSIPLTVMRTKGEVQGLRRFPEDLEAQCQLLVRIADPASVQDSPGLNTVALVRGRGMVVRYWPQKNIVVGGRPFHAVLLAGDAVGTDLPHIAAEQFLRASEPPAHDKWEYNDELRDNYQRGTGQRLKEFFDRITETLRRAIRPTDEGDEEGPAELRRLLRLTTGVPKPPPPATIRRSSARPEDGSWEIEGVIHINDRTRRWRIIPRLSLDVESGSAIRLGWDHLEVGQTEAEIEGTDVILLKPGARRVRFRGKSRAEAEGVPATSCRLKLDLRLDEAAAAEED